MIDNNLAVNFFSPSAVVPENMNGNNFDTSKVGMEYDLSGGVSTQGICLIAIQLQNYSKILSAPAHGCFFYLFPLLDCMLTRC